MFKKLIRFVVLLAVLAAGGLLWFQQSIYYALMELRDGVAAADVERVERHADFERLAQTTLDYAQAVTEDGAKAAGGDLGAGLAKAMGDLLRAGIGKDVEKGMVDELRATIAEGKAFEMIGEFQPKEGVDGLGKIVDGPKGEKMVEIHGTCQGTDVTVVALFERAPKGPADLFGTWKAVGATRKSLDTLATKCRRGASTR